jgi:DegV family protein with EDD domain
MTVYLYGLHFKHAVIAGAQRVVRMQSHLDEINVFPVPDADTGTNMASMLRSVAEALRQCNESSLYRVSDVVAHSAFMSARGSSGAILAQYFQGLSEGLHGRDRADAVAFAEAALHAASLARQAVAVPRDGTILTVMQDWAEHLRMSCKLLRDHRKLMAESVEAAHRSLEGTTQKLDVLRDAGVVDAGAQGFVYMIEGATSYLQSGRVEELSFELPAVRLHSEAEASREIVFQFCTQATIVGTSIDRNAVLNDLRALGDSLIVAGSSTTVHLHIHSNDPETVFGRARAYGAVVRTQKEDMRRQHALARRENPRSIAIITDSSCDLPDAEIARYQIRVVPHVVNLGADSYVESSAFKSDTLYPILAASEHFPKTAHASAADFRSTFLDAAASHDRAFAIMLSGAISGALGVARQTAEVVSDVIRVETIDSKSTSVGLGLIVLEAARAVEAGRDAEDVKRRIDWAIRNVRLFVSVETIEYLARSGRVTKLQGAVARVLRIKPILTMSADGRGEVVGRALGSVKSKRKLLRLVKSAAAGKRNLRFLVGHANAPATAQFYAEQICEMFAATRPQIVSMSAAFGAHLGSGAAAVAFLEDYPQEPDATNRGASPAVPQLGGT